MHLLVTPNMYFILNIDPQQVNFGFIGSATSFSNDHRQGEALRPCFERGDGIRLKFEFAHFDRMQRK